MILRTRISETDRRKARGPRQAGLLLGECLLYITLWSVVTGLSFAAFYRGWDNARTLRRNTGDITRAVNAGERWREDLHGAVGPIQLATAEGGADQALHIPGAGGEVIYYFTGTNVLRRANAGANWVEVLAAVKASRMQQDIRGRGTAWRWELELNPGKRKVKLRPLFTFQAVAGKERHP